LGSWKEEDILTGFLAISIICHGMFFLREWLILGLAVILYRGGTALKKNHRKLKIKFSRGPQVIFFLLAAFSLLGLLHPLRESEGLAEAFRWLLYLTVYNWGRSLSGKEEIRSKIFQRVLTVAVILAIIAWLPASDLIWSHSGPPGESRFALSFGYANAAAVFLGFQLLLLLKEKKINYFYLFVFSVSMFCTASRAASALLIIFTTVLLLKRKALSFQENSRIYGEQSLGFYPKALYGQNLVTSLLVLAAVIFLLFQAAGHWDSSLKHLLDWTDTSLRERLVYYLDSIKLSAQNFFLPQAGGWLAFPFIQTVPYWTLDPHSSFCSILLEQGLAGIILLFIWSIKGIACYLKELIRGNDMEIIASKSAVLYLGLHSLVDIDMAFGALGILFWLFVGLNSRQAKEQAG